MSTARDWFERTLPAQLAARFDDFLATRGAIAVRVDDEAWTVQFGDFEHPVIEGAQPAAALHLRFRGPAFEAFIEGTLDAAAAAAKGDVTFHGELELLEALSRLLLPLQRDLGWDAG